jgi:hypothetical protein
MRVLSSFPQPIGGKTKFQKSYFQPINSAVFKNVALMGQLRALYFFPYPDKTFSCTSGQQVSMSFRVASVISFFMISE